MGIHSVDDVTDEEYETIIQKEGIPVGQTLHPHNVNVFKDNIHTSTHFLSEYLPHKN